MSLAASSQKIYLPFFTTFERYSIGLASLGFVLSAVANREHLHLIRIAERLSFFVIFLFAFQIVVSRSKDRSSNLGVTFLFLSAIMVLALLKTVLVSSPIPFSDRNYPFFENRNMLTEALVLCFIMYLMFCRSSFLHFIYVSLLLAGTVILYVAMSRSALFILVSVLFILGWNSSWGKRLRWGRYLLYVALLLIICLVPFFTKSSQIRLNLINQSFDMIVRHPVGVGIGEFPFAQIPYEWNLEHQLYSFRLFKSPHNEFLRLAAEEGLLVAVPCYGILWSVFWRVIRRATSLTAYAACLSLGLFLIVDSLFQFPFENPYPSYALALAFAQVTSDRTVVIHHGVWTKALALVGIVFLEFIILVHFSVAGRLVLPTRINRWLCTASPDFYSFCLVAAEQYNSRNDPESAIDVLTGALVRQPNNIQLLKWTIVQKSLILPSTVRDEVNDIIPTLLGKGSGRFRMESWNDVLKAEKVLIPKQ